MFSEKQSKQLILLFISVLLGHVAIFSSIFPLIVISIYSKRFRLVPKPFMLLAITLFLINFYNLFLFWNNVSDQMIYYQFFNIIEIITYVWLFYFLAGIERKLFINFSILFTVPYFLLINFLNYDFEYISSLYLKLIQFGLCLYVIAKLILSNDTASFSKYPFRFFLFGLIVYSSVSIYTTLFERIIIGDKNELYAVLWFLPQISGLIFHIFLSLNLWKIVRQ